MLTETKLSQMVGRLWIGWYDRIQPAHGSTMGFPDLLLFDPAVGHLPVELKLGHHPQTNLIRTSDLRPAQIRWHKGIAQHGGFSAILIGVPDGKGSATIYAVNGRDCERLLTDIGIFEGVATKIAPVEFRTALLSWVKMEKSHAKSRP
jgi:hypothetical protein